MQQGHDNKENYQQLKKLSIVTQTLHVSTLGNVWKTVWRIPLLMLGFKGFNNSYKSRKLSLQTFIEKDVENRNLKRESLLKMT